MQWPKYFASVVGFFVLVGCSTNKLGDPKKTKYIEHLSKKGETIMGQIDHVQSDKERRSRVLKMHLSELEEKIKKEYGQKGFYVKQMKEGIQLTILDRILFRSGSADINTSGEKVLEKLASLLSETRKHIQITGHTDNTPIIKSKNKFKTNWDLSLRRALSVLHVFEKGGIVPQKMFAVGYGEYRPVRLNDTKKNRSQNRRVEILILDEVKRVNARAPKKQTLRKKKSYIK
jgi:chemotaxis protein MotB